MTARAFSPVIASSGALSGRRVLVVGAGGLGCPALLALADSGATLVIADDDVVDATNLHRQLLFDESDVGRDKLDAVRAALLALAVPPERIELVRTRLLPENARALVRCADLVLEGADNYATKFLACDAAHLEGRPIVHGSAIRLQGTVWAVASGGKPCYRCLFEDVPGGAQLGCNEAGVLGPVVGICGALMAELAFRCLLELEPGYGSIVTLDGRANRLRRVEVPARADCALCSSRATISEIDETRYTAASCAA